MAKKKLDSMSLTTAQEVYDFYNVVNGYDKEDVEETDLKECINSILDKYDTEDIRYVVGAHQAVASQVVFDFGYFDMALEAKKAKEELTKSLPAGVNQTNYALQVLTDALLSNVQETKGTELVDWAKAELFKEYGPLKRQVELISVDGTKIEGVVHDKFGIVSELVNIRENVLLTGPAGTGKSRLAKQVAQAIGAHIYLMNSPQQPYEIEGFVDANGKFNDTQFTLFARDKELSVCIIEEIDNMNPSVGVKINDALDAHEIALPNGEVIDFNDKKHIFIASANTWGTGATADYVGRNKLDAATLNRWQPVMIDYDRQIEEALCPNTELLEFIRTLRSRINYHGIHHIISYRNLGSAYNWINTYPNRDIEEIIKTTLIRNLEPNDLSVLADDLGNDKYSRVVKEYAGR